MSQDQIRRILENYKVVAVVGLSKDPNKDSNRIGAYLKEHGYHIVPVNPFTNEVFGEKSYASLLDVPSEVQKTIEIVSIFRPSNDVPPVVEQAIELNKMFGKPLVIWMQTGIINEAAAEKARAAGLTVIMDKCLMIERENLNQGKELKS